MPLLSLSPVPLECNVCSHWQWRLHAAGVALTQPLCLALLSVFEACGQSEQAQDVLQAASNAEIHLNTDLYNAVLRCCILEQHGGRAIQIWHDMEVGPACKPVFSTLPDHAHTVQAIYTCQL